MKTRLLLGAAVVVAAVPAIIGLWGNASFSQQLPVRVPASGQVVPLNPSPTPSVSPSTGIDDHGADDQGIDDHGIDDQGIDDHGGLTPRDQRSEPGDDRTVQGSTTAPSGGSGEVEPGDDHGGATGGGATGGGADDPIGHDATDDHVSSGSGSSGSGGSGSSGSGSGSSGSGSDSHGSGHGSDD